MASSCYNTWFFMIHPHMCNKMTTLRQKIMSTIPLLLITTFQKKLQPTHWDIIMNYNPKHCKVNKGFLHYWLHNSYISTGILVDLENIWAYHICYTRQNWHKYVINLLTFNNILFFVSFHDYILIIQNNDFNVTWPHMHISVLYSTVTQLLPSFCPVPVSLPYSLSSTCTVLYFMKI